MNEKQIVEALEEMLSDYYVRIEYLDAINSACDYIKHRMESKESSGMRTLRYFGYFDGISGKGENV